MSFPSLWRRLAAMVYDGLILLAISMLYGFILIGINLAINGAPDSGKRINWNGFEILIFIGWLLICMFYYVYFWRRIGQTVGMKTWRLQSLSHTGHTMSWRQAWLRAALALVSFTAAGAGFWFALFDPQQQTLHDRFSATVTYLTPKNR